MSYRAAADVAAEIRAQLGDVPGQKLHKFLYYCQGRHLAATGRPLFTESVSARDMGPVIGQLWKSEQTSGPAQSGADLDQAAHNTVGYVLQRYGGLTGLDLERLSHAESPWRLADQGRESNPADGIRRRVTSWLLTRQETRMPESSERRGFADLRYGVVPNTWHGGGYMVTCSYWVAPRAMRIRCGSLATLIDPA